MIYKMMKDMVDEYRGVDVEARNRQEREERERAEKEYKENNFAPLWVKRSSIVIAILYFFISALMIYGYIKSQRIIAGIGVFILLICATAGAIMMNIKDKQKQIYGCIIFGIFLLIQSIKSFIVA